jgi:hypothetical protein
MSSSRLNTLKYSLVKEAEAESVNLFWRRGAGWIIGRWMVSELAADNR